MLGGHPAADNRCALGCKFEKLLLQVVFKRIHERLAVNDRSKRLILVLVSVELKACRSASFVFIQRTSVLLEVMSQ